VNQDGLWKKIIGELFEDFLLFFAAELHSVVDFSKAPDFLQQELFKEILDDKKGTNYVDQVVKVHLKDGTEKWILVHVEVESSTDIDFPKRMFRYFYRIFDKYEREIVAFAVLTGPTVSIKMTGFNYSYFGTMLNYTYNTCKVIDYDDKELTQSNRLFSKVVLAAKYLHETKNEEERRYRFKLKLMREVLKLEGHSRESISAVFYFIDYLLRLPEQLAQQFTETVRPIIKQEGQMMVQFEKNDLPPTFAELMAMEWKEGLEQGLEQGIGQGKLAGEEKIKKDIAITMLHENFEIEQIAKLTKLTIIEVQQLKEKLT